MVTFTAAIRFESSSPGLPGPPSRAALLRIGAVEEGTMRNHIIMPDGRLRHSVYFSIIESEWPTVKARLEGLLVR